LAQAIAYRTTLLAAPCSPGAAARLMARCNVQLALLLTLVFSSGAFQLTQLGAGNGAGNEVGNGEGNGAGNGAGNDAGNGAGNDAGNGAGNGAENEGASPAAVDASAWLSATGNSDEADIAEEKHAYLLGYLKSVVPGGTPETGIAQAIEALRAHVAAKHGPQLASATAHGHLELLARDTAWYKATVKAKADDLAFVMQAAAAETHKIFYRDFASYFFHGQSFEDAQKSAVKSARKAMAVRYGQELGAALAQNWAKDVSGHASFKVPPEAERKAELLAKKFAKNGPKEAKTALDKARAEANEVFYLAYLDDVAGGAQPEAAVATAVEAQRQFLAGAASPELEAAVAKERVVELATDSQKAMAAVKAAAADLSKKMEDYEKLCSYNWRSMYHMMVEGARQPMDAAIEAAHEAARECLSNLLGKRTVDRLVSKNKRVTDEAVKKGA